MSKYNFLINYWKVLKIEICKTAKAVCEAAKEAVKRWWIKKLELLRDQLIYHVQSERAFEMK